MRSIPWTHACARRLARHGLAVPVPRERLAAHAGAICGVHAQVQGAAETSLALRVAGATRADVRAALWEERSLVRTYGSRGTVHLLPAAELGRWLAALAAVPRADVSLPDGVRFDDAQREAVLEAIAEELRDAELTAEELTAALVERLGPWTARPAMPAFTQSWPRWRQLLVAAALRGALCFGGGRGRAVTYVSPRAWAGAAAAVPGGRDAGGDAASAGDGDAALGWLADRFLRAYGPATAPQLARWLAAPPRWTGDLVARLGRAGRIEPVRFEGEEAWVAAGDAEAPAAQPSGVRLLPHYDAYGIGCYPRSRVVPGDVAERALVRGQAGPYPLLLVDGVVAGTWRGRRAGRRLALEVRPLRALGRVRAAALAEEAQRLAAIAGAQEARLDVTAG